MADHGHELTDQMLEELEERIAEEYAIAVRDMEKKLQKYLDQFTEADEKQRERLDNGEITQKEYADWRHRQMMMNQRWESMRDTLAQDMHHANELALGIARGKMPDVYALNHNYGLYEIETGGQIDTSLTLYNHDTAAYLLQQERQLMSGPSTRKQREIAANKDMQWNQRKIQSAVLQGVLQGETPAAVARRLMSVGQMNYNSAVRYARTMTTNAQNAGRYQSYHRAKELGVKLTIEWRATLDNRTRHEHRQMHGQRRDVDEPFVVTEANGDTVEILWPGNDKCGTSTVPQEQIWNCRCTLRAMVKGHEIDTVKDSPGMGGMSFEEWQNAKAPEEKPEEPKQEPSKPTNIFQNVKGLDETFTQGMHDALEACDNEDAKALYKKYADELVCVESDRSSGAFFRRSDGGVHMNAENVAKGNNYDKPYQTAFHEFGHMIDWLANDKDVYYLSNQAIDGKYLLEVLKKDFTAFKKTCGVRRAEDVIPVLQGEHLTPYARGNLSDILEKFTHKAYPLGFGHGLDYHRRDGATEKEFFAEVMDSAVTNPEAYAQLQRVFPNGVDFVWKLVRSII